MAPLNRKVALITGANGITGNALVEELIRQPESEWSKIVITSRRPTQVFWQDPRVVFLPLDFLRPADELVEAMALLCHDVTHAFFASYVHTADFKTLKDCNVPLFENFLVAIDKVARDSLQRVILHTGGKHYGIHLGPTEAPVHEGMGRYEDYGENFYYYQEDFMFAMAAKRQWDWNIIRPHAIIGYTPAGPGNGMSEALTLAIYILCCQENGNVPVFPGNEFFYNTVDDASFAPSIADMSRWAATHDHTKNEAFNHTNGDTFMWKYLWPKLLAYFGVELPDTQEWQATGEDHTRMSNNFLMTEWAKGKEPLWTAVVAKHGGNPQAFQWGTWDFFDWAVGKAWVTIGSVGKARKYGWTRYEDTYECWVKTFRSFENAGVLPMIKGQGAFKPAVPRTKLLPNPGALAQKRAAALAEKEAAEAAAAATTMVAEGEIAALVAAPTAESAEEEAPAATEAPDIPAVAPKGDSSVVVSHVEQVM
ncbi:hypothetical protein SEUCBS140593_005518 [Sporothrix eucalyptigena]|uniref:PRISE-like Rossmann-fold domain-containing protein n=1 Tax=Sporothrix eucalyptigena TaxID=1812306 RepID=A0ABP0BZ20_9PEZI